MNHVYIHESKDILIQTCFSSIHVFFSRQNDHIIIIIRQINFIVIVYLIRHIVGTNLNLILIVYIEVIVRLARCEVNDFKCDRKKSINGVI